MSTLTRPLTRQNLNYIQFYLLPDKEQQAGRALYNQGMAQVIEFSPGEARCRVTDGRQTFEVSLQNAQYSPTFKCACPESARLGQCRHMLAATLATREYIIRVAEKDWAYRVEVGLDKARQVFITQSQRSSGRQTPAIVLATLNLRPQSEHYGATCCCICCWPGAGQRCCHWPAAQSRPRPRAIC